ncbi:hypothetical protein M231_05118 [Tremella mesenterica]|uniref:Uncharacterized protein n=1 Tax=Tremella mesenterica TaxID=5217 RepID=A0A4Q1BIV9_TREME|nr:hypothetical protein M231_05118 [Tremella mesenterica]
MSSSKRSPSPPEDETSSSKKAKGTPGQKARIPVEAKVIIAVEIIMKGLATINVDELVEKTGLTKQQIKSQLADNRQNVRKQLIELARTLT